MCHEQLLSLVTLVVPRRLALPSVVRKRPEAETQRCGEASWSWAMGLTVNDDRLGPGRTETNATTSTTPGCPRETVPSRETTASTAASSSAVIGMLEKGSR